MNLYLFVFITLWVLFTVVTNVCLVLERMRVSVYKDENQKLKSDLDECRKQSPNFIPGASQ